MSIQITIGLPDEHVSRDALDRHMEALGFSRGPTLQSVVVEAREAEAASEPAQKAEEPAPKATRGRKKAEPASNISTSPEDRKPPEDDIATQEQDAADEQAEVEAAREPEAPLTAEDVKAAVGLYVEQHGMAATQEDGPSIFVSALGKPPGNEPIWKMSLLADVSQDRLKKLVQAWTDAAGAGKRFGA